MVQKDQALISKALEGDREAFGILVERYARLVHGVILHKVRRPDEVEDLVQDVFCKAFEKLPSLREPEKFAPWLARMASNQAQAWLRQRQTQQTYHDEGIALTHTGGMRPDQLLEADETSGIVWEALDRLPLELRQVLLLYHFEGCSQQEMARFLGVNLSTVKWRLMRGRQSLRRKLEEVFALERHQAHGGTRRLRTRVLAALPLVGFFQPIRSRWGWPEAARLWIYRRLLPMVYAAALGTGGVLFFQAHVGQESRQPTGISADRKIAVRLESGSAFLWSEEGAVSGGKYPPCAAAYFERAGGVESGELTVKTPSGAEKTAP